MQPSQLAGDHCGRRYEKEYINKFRDCMSFYFDGKVRFERFCYGEGACFVFGAWATMQPDGSFVYAAHDGVDFAPSALPQALTSQQGDTLFFDEKRFKWELASDLREDAKNGYTPFKVFFWRLFKK